MTHPQQMTCGKSLVSAQLGYPQPCPVPPQLCSPPACCQGCPQTPSRQGAENRELLFTAPRLLHQQLKDQLQPALL